MCQIHYYYLDAADKILKVVYCTRLASDVLIIKVNSTDMLPPSDAKLGGSNLLHTFDSNKLKMMK